MSRGNQGHRSIHQGESKQIRKRGRRGLIRPLFFWGLLVLVSGTSGAALALFTTTPLKHRNAHSLPNSSDRLSTLLPVTLGRPINILVLGIDNSGHPHSNGNRSMLPKGI